MTPTPRLRFVQREVLTFATLNGIVLGESGRTTVQVLQQWCNDTGPNGGPDLGEWRDVPLEAE